MLGQLIISSLVMGCIYALMALAMGITYKSSEVPNFAQGEMAMVSTFVTFVMLSSFGMNFYVAIICTMIFAFALGLILEFVFLRRAKEPNALNLIVITIGFQLMLYGLAGWKWGSEQKQINLPFSATETVFESETLVLTELNLATIIIAIVVLVLIYLLIQRTKLGLAMKACQQNINASKMNGIPANVIMAITFGISSMVGAVAGILVAPIATLDPTMMWEPLLKGFAAAVLGGMKSLHGVVIGGLLLALAENIFGYYVSIEFKSVVAFAIIVLVLYFKPSGLFDKHYVRKV